MGKRYEEGDGDRIFHEVCGELGLEPHAGPEVVDRIAQMLGGPIGLAATACHGNPGLLMWVSAILETHARIARLVAEESFDTIAKNMGLKADDE